MLPSRRKYFASARASCYFFKHRLHSRRLPASLLPRPVGAPPEALRRLGPHPLPPHPRPSRCGLGCASDSDSMRETPPVAPFLMRGQRRAQPQRLREGGAERGADTLPGGGERGPFTHAQDPPSSHERTGRPEQHPGRAPLFASVGGPGCSPGTPGWFPSLVLWALLGTRCSSSLHPPPTRRPCGLG